MIVVFLKRIRLGGLHPYPLTVFSHEDLTTKDGQQINLHKSHCKKIKYFQARDLNSYLFTFEYFS